MVWVGLVTTAAIGQPEVNPGLINRDTGGQKPSDVALESEHPDALGLTAVARNYRNTPRNTPGQLGREHIVWQITQLPPRYLGELNHR